MPSAAATELRRVVLSVALGIVLVALTILVVIGVDALVIG